METFNFLTAIWNEEKQTINAADRNLNTIYLGSVQKLAVLESVFQVFSTVKLFNRNFKMFLLFEYYWVLRLMQVLHASCIIAQVFWNETRQGYIFGLFKSFYDCLL